MELEAKNISFSYCTIPLLHEVSLKIHPGSLTMMIGPNGCGKTTFLKLLTGYLKPQSGMVQLNGKDISQYSAKQRARMVSVAPQSQIPALDFTVKEMVMSGRYPRLSLLQPPSADDMNMVESAMKELEIGHLADQLCSRLSGGECQRMQIASVIASDAPVMLFDEPTSAMDPAHAVSVMESLKKRSLTKSIFVLTHDLQLAMRYADELILLSDGGIFANGKPEFVLTPDNLKSVFNIGAEQGRTVDGISYIVLK